ncbi:uncharacterized protein LOC106711169 [Papilio machaon]|uniref:uncharacterized protein LOC106711169 n=1 Tax=Papilio machaon TaxID=76193 RepID=UPI001E6636D5|nr:uncharacterized protein LOC106711169 [Papilio machaon]
MCKDYLKPNTTSSKDLNLVIEQCLNTSFWEQYKLKTRIKEDTKCHTQEQYYPIEPIDIVVAVILLCILMLNLAGSVYDILIVKKSYSGNKWLLYFSIKRNWSKLTETQKLIGPEIEDCRRDGWQNMLYINNYFDNTRCMAHTWYVAADMQLFILGTFTLVLIRSDQRRQVVLWAMFVLSLFTAPLHTYFQNLYDNIIISPEVILDFFVKDPTFNHSYKRGHTNMACYILGLSLGLIIYKLQQKQLNIEKYKKYKYMFWATCPMMIILILCRGLMYMDGVTPHPALKAICAGLYRPLFGLLIFLFILGMVFKLENVYRPTLEWRGWTSAVRVSYSVYIVHLMLILISVSSITTLNHLTIYEALLSSFGTITFSFLCAVPLWLLVESPISQVVQQVTSSKKTKSSKMKSIDNSIVSSSEDKKMN